MKTITIHHYIVCIDEMEQHIECNMTRKRLEQYITDDKSVDGTFRPMRMRDRIIKDGFYFVYLFKRGS